MTDEKMIHELARLRAFRKSIRLHLDSRGVDEGQALDDLREQMEYPFRQMDSESDKLVRRLCVLLNSEEMLLDACRLLVATAGSYLEGLEAGCERHELSAEESRLYNAINDAKEVIAKEKPHAG